jgi:hypothetical protein
MRNGVRKAIEREARAGKAREMPKHGRSLVHVLNAIAKRAEQARPAPPKRRKQR